jgi:hypothetical protein
VHTIHSQFGKTRQSRAAMVSPALVGGKLFMVVARSQGPLIGDKRYTGKSRPGPDCVRELVCKYSRLSLSASPGSHRLPKSVSTCRLETESSERRLGPRMPRNLGNRYNAPTRLADQARARGKGHAPGRVCTSTRYWYKYQRTIGFSSTSTNGPHLSSHLAT